MRKSRLAIAAIVMLAATVAAPAIRADTIRGRAVPQTDRLDRIRLLAHQVDDTAAGLSRAAVARRGHPVFGAEVTIRAFRGLAWRADAFHRSVERFRPAPRIVEADYRALLRAYDDALRSTRYARVHPVQRRQLERLGRLIDDLTDAYRPIIVRLDRDARGHRADRDRYRPGR